MVGPLGHLVAERQRLEALVWQQFDVKRLGATIGAVVDGVDLTAPLPAEVVAELRQLCSTTRCCSSVISRLPRLNMLRSPGSLESSKCTRSFPGTTRSRS